MLGDQIGPLFADVDFADLYAADGAPDVTQVAGIHARLTLRNLLPAEHLVDAGTTAGPVLVESLARAVRLVGPLSDESSWQARTPSALTSAQFRLDWAQQVAVCPQGQRAELVAAS